MHLIYFLKQTFIGIANLYQTQSRCSFLSKNENRDHPTQYMIKPTTDLYKNRL